MRSLAVALAIGGALIGTGHGAATQPADSTTFRSRHYQVTTNLDAREANRIAGHMDRVYEEYDRRFAAFPVKGGTSYPLYIFSTQERYLEHLRGDGIDGSNTAGVFYISPEDDGLATFVGGMPRSVLLSTLQHEGFHQFAWSRIGRRVPVWANEGLAEYFGAAYLVRRRFMLGQVEEGRLERLRTAIEQGRAIPLERLLSMTDREWSARVSGGHEQAGLQYDQAWSVAHFLIEGDRGKYERMFLAYLEAVGTGLQHQQAFERAFGTTDYGSFEAAWKRHVAKIEPDPVSTALVRLSFLARGLQGLHEAGRTPGTFDALRKELVDSTFKAFSMTHGSFRVLSAEDTSLFEVPPEKAGADPGTPELVASGDPELPPALRSRVGRTTANVVWTRDASGALSYEIEIE